MLPQRHSNAWIEFAGLVSEAVFAPFRRVCKARFSVEQLTNELFRLHDLYYRIVYDRATSEDMCEFAVLLGFVPESSRVYARAQRLQAELLAL